MLSIFFVGVSSFEHRIDLLSLEISAHEIAVLKCICAVHINLFYMRIGNIVSNGSSFILFETFFCCCRRKRDGNVYIDTFLFASKVIVHDLSRRVRVA